MNRAALDWQLFAPEHDECSFRSGRAIADREIRPLQAASRSSRNSRQAAVFSPPMFRIESSTFWPSRRTPIAANTEVFVALRSMRGKDGWSARWVGLLLSRYRPSWRLPRIVALLDRGIAGVHVDMDDLSSPNLLRLLFVNTVIGKSGLGELEHSPGRLGPPA